jgi:hypothetical protein
MITNKRPCEAVCKTVIDGFEHERNKIFAIASALRTQLKPDQTEIEYHNYNEWLLCEVICDILADAHIVKSAREDLYCEAES